MVVDQLTIWPLNNLNDQQYLQSVEIMNTVEPAI